MATATTRLSDFNIKRKLGEGSYSQVSLAIRKQDGLEYALKQVNIAKLNEKERENALNEVRFLASIRHKNIIGYRAAFLDEPSKTLCIVMEFANDGDLLHKIQDLRKKGIFFGEQEIWRIFLQLAMGLHCLHQMNIMHRDLKPANVFLWKGTSQLSVNNSILIEDEGRPLAQHINIAKIGDMNVSKLAQLDGLNYTQTGTPYYASPEVWRDQPYDFKSDVWSLGCILYEMTALRAPFQAKDMDELFKKVTKGSYQKVPPVYSPELAGMIKALLTVDPAYRPSILHILSMPCVQSRIEKIFPEDAHGLIVGSSLVNHSIISNKKNSSRSSQPKETLKKGQSGANSCTLLQTIRDTKDMKALKQQLPKANFESQVSVDEHNLSTHHQSILKDVDVNSSIISAQHLHDQGSIRANQAAERLGIQHSESKKQSSLSLLARNQSQKILNMGKEQVQQKGQRQLQILPTLSKGGKDYSDRLLQRLRESSQMLKRSSTRIGTGVKTKQLKQSRNGMIDMSYNSISQDEIQQDHDNSGRVSLSNSRPLNQSQKQRSSIIMERARSEQRLLNINTPSTNLLPILDIVNEVIPQPTKKMNLKSINKRIAKNQTNGAQQNPTSYLLQNSKHLKPPLSPSQSPKRQYGAAVTSNLTHKLLSEHSSISNSLIKRDSSNYRGGARQETKIIARESSIEDLGANLHQSLHSQRLDLEGMQKSKKRRNELSNHPLEVNDGIRLQLPQYVSERASMMRQIMQTNERDSPPPDNSISLKPQIIRNVYQQNPLLDGLYLSSEMSRQMSPPKEVSPIKKPEKTMSNSKSIGSIQVGKVFERQSEIFMNIRQKNKQQHLKPFFIQDLRQDVNNSLLNESVDGLLSESRLGQNQSVCYPPAKMKPVKVIPSSKRRKDQQKILSSIQKLQQNMQIEDQNIQQLRPNQPQNQSQLTSLRPSNSNINLNPISSTLLKGCIQGQLNNINNSQNTTVLGPHESIVEPHFSSYLQHHNTVSQNRYDREESQDNKPSLIGMSSHSYSKPLLLPLRQQLYMDEKNPFLDDYTINKVRVETNTNRNNSKNSLINYNEIMSDHYSVKNSQRNNQIAAGAPSMIYQMNTHSLQGNNLQNMMQEPQNNNSSMLLQSQLNTNHKRNNSSFDYADPRSMRQGSHLNLNNSFGHKSGHQPTHLPGDHPDHAQSRPAFALPTLANQQHSGIQPLLLNPRSSSSSAYLVAAAAPSGRDSSQIMQGDKTKRKNRIGLLEKARKVLIDQQSRQMLSEGKVDATQNDTQ